MSDPFRARPMPPPRAPQVAYKTLKYRPSHEHLVRRLGAALVLQWDELPDALQDLIIDQAAAVEDREEGPHEASDIENFVRTVKTQALTKVAMNGDAAPKGDA